jgi:hypothetical protein
MQVSCQVPGHFLGLVDIIETRIFGRDIGHIDAV